MLGFYLSLVDTPEDKHLVEQLYNNYKKLMHHMAKEILHDDYLAEDAVHQAFMNIMKTLSNIRGVSCPQTRSYCVIICRRVALDMLRRRRDDRIVRADDLPDRLSDGANFEDEIIAKMDLQIIIDKVLDLPDIYRDIFYLYYSNDLSLKQISKVLGISYEAAKKRLQRARQQLFFMLQEEGTKQK